MSRTIKPNESCHPTRRDFMRSAGSTVSIVLGSSLIPGAALAAAHRLVLVSYGGSYQADIEQTLAAPFTRETGIGVTFANPDFAKVKAQIMTGNIEWDLWDAGVAAPVVGARLGYWEKIDRSIVDISELFVTPPSEYYMPYYGWALGVCFDPKRHPEGKHPRNFAEFYDVDRFPGRRIMRPVVDQAIEPALLADGMPADQIYPLTPEKIDRAFRMLDRIKPHVVKWVESVPQLTSLIQANEADFSLNYPNRAKSAHDAGASIAVSFDQTIGGLVSLCVLKGAPHKEAAMRYIALVLRKDRQAAFCERQGFLPMNRHALALLSADAKRWIPDPSKPTHFTMKSEEWADLLEPLQARFRQWILS